ncbi:hypothetical protein [Simkania negevensis]|uniref:Uncharacterized protein n=1 Tax=Simkania negevensis (strain ATCC VR-1471 / DSM 27360 / Z) TaxID=331113 RepID=F8L4J6_SIMNZ|nr:hypothetical protein [Simkania negevensis]CCB90250.1 putative uncharacterized protein [Simkania negevensis Z]
MISNQLIEIVFENIQLKKISALISELTENGSLISDYYASCECDNINWNEEISIEEFFNSHSNFGLFINLSEIKKGSFVIPNSSITVYKNEGTIDLEINFELKDLNNFSKKTLKKKLMAFSKELAADYHISNYYCGLEPAKDFETRLFTKDQAGPLSL